MSPSQHAVGQDEQRRRGQRSAGVGSISSCSWTTRCSRVNLGHGGSERGPPETLSLRSQSAVFSTLCFVGTCCALQASTVQEAIHLEGVVIGRDRAPLAAVHIILSAVESAAGTQPPAGEPAPELLAAVSDERGVFRFPALRAGRYRLLCESEGYEPYRGEPFAIDEKSHPDIVILLVPSSAPGEGERGDFLDRLRRRREANPPPGADRKSTRLNSSHDQISYA